VRGSNTSFDPYTAHLSIRIPPILLTIRLRSARAEYNNMEAVGMMGGGRDQQQHVAQILGGHPNPLPPVNLNLAPYTDRLLRKENSTINSSNPSSSPTATEGDAPPPLGGFDRTGMKLETIGLTLVGGLCVSFLTIFAFGVAVMMRHTNIAPRCTSRHPNTIWRSRQDMYGKRSNHADTEKKKKTEECIE